MNDHLMKVYGNAGGFVAYDQPSGSTTTTFAAAAVKSFRAIARSGNDTVDLRTSFGGIPFLDSITVDGEEGEDHLYSPPFGEVKLSEGDERLACSPKVVPVVKRVITHLGRCEEDSGCRRSAGGIVPRKW